MKYIEIHTIRKRKRVFFFFEFNRTLIDKINQIPTASFDYNDKTWKSNLNNTTAEYIYVFCTYFKFDMPDEFINIYDEYKASNKLNESLSKAETSNIEIKHGFVGTPYEFQTAGVEFIIKNIKHSFIGDEQGLGKTIEAILSIHHLDLFPVLLIMPNSLRYNWADEFKKWLPYISDSDISIVGRTGVIEDFQKKIVIVNYDKFSRMTIHDLFFKQIQKIKFKLMVLDESHYCKSSKSQRTKSIVSLSKKIPHKILLSGTGSTGLNVDLVPQLNILNVLKEFGGSVAFKNRYCDPNETKWGMEYKGNTNNKELHTKLRQICYLRRNKKDVLKDLPDKIRSGIYVELTNQKQYAKAELNFRKYILDKKMNDADFLDSIKDMSPKQKHINKRLHMATEKKKINLAETLLKLQHLNELALKGKKKGIIDWVENFFESTTNQKLVLFAQRTQFIKDLANHFKCDYIIGDGDIKDRQRMINDFQTKPENNLIILNEAIGVVGHTLTAASYLAFCDIPDRPHTVNQGEDRIHRIGQEDVANIYFFIGKDTLNEEHYARVIDMMKITNTVNAGVEDEQIISHNFDVNTEMIKYFSR